MGDNVFVSFDIDSISAADAPVCFSFVKKFILSQGVSAVGTIGLTSQEALNICLIAGKHPKVKLFDLSEYNPLVEEWRTGKLVANMFYFFALGLSIRSQ